MTNAYFLLGEFGQKITGVHGGFTRGVRTPVGLDQKGAKDWFIPLLTNYVMLRNWRQYYMHLQWFRT